MRLWRRYELVERYTLIQPAAHDASPEATITLTFPPPPAGSDGYLVYRVTHERVPVPRWWRRVAAAVWRGMMQR